MVDVTQAELPAVCLQVASDPRVSFFGNVCLGEDVSAAQLSELYDVVVLAYGAAGDKELPVKGADLAGVFAARAFVSWSVPHMLERSEGVDGARLSNYSSLCNLSLAPMRFFPRFAHLH